VYYARKGDEQKAVNAFNACISNDFNYMEAYMEKGFLYYEDKKISDALKVFQTAATVKNTYADSYYWMAKCYEALNNKTEAINSYQRSLSLDPGIKEATAALQRLGVR
jgi:tetratricopeptide (TPR) repeat protein